MDYKKKIGLGILIVLCAISGMVGGWNLGAYIFKTRSEKFLIPKPVLYTDTVKIEGFSEAKLMQFMKDVEIQYPNIVMHQAKLETGNFTSPRFIKYNALFGFQTSDTDVIKYKSWKESVIAYKAWQMKRLKTNEDYHRFLIRVHYAADSNYIKKLKQFK